MKKDMSTFEMAQAAYENPGKVFVGNSKEPHSSRMVKWGGGGILDCASGDVLTIEAFQVDGYFWNEKVEPRKWSGEYERNERGGIAGDDCGAPFAVIPHGVKARVKWEAEEVL